MPLTRGVQDLDIRLSGCRRVAAEDAIFTSWLLTRMNSIGILTPSIPCVYAAITGCLITVHLIFAPQLAGERQEALLQRRRREISLK